MIKPRKVWRKGQYVLITEPDPFHVKQTPNPVFTEEQQDRLLGISNGLAGVSAHDASRPVASKGHKAGQRYTAAIKGEC